MSNEDNNEKTINFGDIGLNEEKSETTATEQPEVEVCEEAEIIDDEVTKLSEENEKLLDKYKRTLAEFDNFRKRTNVEKSQRYDMGVSDTIDKVLPIVDGFERAISTFNDKDNAYYKGFEMVLKQFYSILESLGVEEIDCEGQKFDIHFHHAVTKIKSDDYETDDIVEVIQKGYKYKDKVIRFCMVCVAE